MKATVQIERISVDAAKKMVTEDLLNEQRKLREHTVEQYAADMTAGRWKLSPDAILVVRGKTANGQHRLHAVVRSGRQQDFVVMRTDDEELYKVLDQGLHRKISDAISGMSNVTTVAAAASRVFCYDHHLLKYSGESRASTEGVVFTKQAVMEYIDAHTEELQEAASFAMSLCNKKAKIVNGSLMAAFFHIASRTCKTKASEFLHALVNGTTTADSIHDLRERMIRNNISRLKLPANTVFAMMIKAYNSWLQGTRPGVLKFLPTEDYPTIRAK